MKVLPVHVADELAEVLNECQQMATWPVQMMVNLMPLLGKPGGGERCVAKTPMLYRTWNRRRRSGQL